MGILDRLGLLAKGKFKVWRQGSETPPGTAALEKELASASPVVGRAADLPAEAAEPPAGSDYLREVPDPSNPKKRTL